nr:MAG TPA: hypothetical protein [Caudoviricetes sp.]
MQECLYDVYVKLDENYCITSVEGTAFHTVEELEKLGYIKIDSGSGNVYGHCQPLYLKEKYGKPTYDEQFHPNYRLVDGKIRDLSDDEKVELFPKPTPQPTEQELINAQLMLEIAKLKAGVQ